MIRPPALRPGDMVGIVSPASPVASFVPRRLARGVAELERQGYRVVVGDNATSHTGHTAGTIEQRLDDLHRFFANDEVRAIVCTIGGYNSHQLLEELDFDLIAANPKVFSGYWTARCSRSSSPRRMRRPATSTASSPSCGSCRLRVARRHRDRPGASERRAG